MNGLPELNTVDYEPKVHFFRLNYASHLFCCLFLFTIISNYNAKLISSIVLGKAAGPQLQNSKLVNLGYGVHGSR